MCNTYMGIVQWLRVYILCTGILVLLVLLVDMPTNIVKVHFC